MDVFGVVVAPHEAIGVGVQHAGLLDELALKPDLHAARQRHTGVVAQGDGVAHQGRVDLQQRAAQADGVVALHAPLGLQQEQVVQIEPGA